ncbi:BspA family leucine-rich repeat surface protein [Lactobacillus sp. M0398]|uniref:BspA family leucine-rich repeat surface protein n=1 Tax=unclassified Lactobacillus TaxID=2620435 RepID=UPI0018DBCD45|nr:MULTISPECIES: BspA family leucine-rich repeat surface protein [unclassified Lactobacillus]MBI0120846.1 BspA family leucine-rich repeat surface protein [Lactobacillus sp. M0398]MBI0122687.1 BspA family leucine-rich repeat surface protein [Lactobacillus sp. W8174]MBI0135161.1 BspA family leucine-rich repeat surface protein [Lactobacillus sp. W8173]
MNKLRNTNKQGEKLLLGGMAAAAFGLISTKPKTVKAANLNGNHSTFKKTKKAAVKTKINYQTARSKLTRDSGSSKPQTSFENQDELTDQNQEDLIGSDSNTNITKPTNSEQNPVSNNDSSQNIAASKNNNKENSSNSNTIQTSSQDTDSNNFDPNQAAKSAVTSKWNGLTVSYESNTDELTIYGGTDTPAVISNNIEPIKKISIDGNINDVASNYVKTITIKGKIKIIGSADNLFADLFNLETINGLENIDTQEVTNMANMFSGSYKLSSLDLSNFDTSNVTDMNSMFYGCSALKNLKFDPAKFNTAKVTNMASMFKSCGVQSIDLSRFNTSNVTNMADMFSGCAVTSLDLSHFDTAKVTDMSGMFNYNVLQALDVSCLDTAKVTNMAKMFANSRNLTSINFGTKDATKFNTSNVTDMSDMFNTSEKLTDIDLSTFNTAKVANMANMFFSCKALTGLDLSPLNTSNVTDMNGMFEYCNGLTSLDVSPLDTAKVTNMARMFHSCQKLTSLDVSTFKTSNVTSMEDMFDYCSSLTDLKFGNPGTTTFDTSNVVTMKNMFAYCSAMVNLDLSAFDTSKVEVFTLMFDNCSRLSNLNLSSFKITAKTNVSGGISMDYMFRNCTSLATIDVSHFDTSNVGNMRGMFDTCYSLTSLDLTNFVTSNVSDMSDMFNQCASLKRLNLSSFDTSNVTNMWFMFANSGLERLDISNFDMSNVSTTESMLGGLQNLKILVLGKKNNIGTSPFNDKLNSGFNTSGTWTNMGSGQVPKDQNSWSADQLVNKYDPSKDYDTYVNFSAPSLITVKYVDNNQKDIVPSDQLYDFKNTALLDTLPTFNSIKLNRNTDYQLEHIKLDEKTVSDLKNVKFGDIPHTITFVYNAIPAGVITVYYKYKDKDGQLRNILDENGKAKTATINGSLHDRSANIKFDALDGYTKESYQINDEDPVINTDDFTVPLTKDPQTVTLIYNPISAGTITVNYKYKDKDGQLQNILDENGKPKTTTINGYLFEHSANIKFDALDGYTKESYQINDEDPVINTNDFTVPLTKDPQTVTLIYNPISAGTITVNYKYKNKDGQLQNILDENGKAKTATINGSLHDRSANIKFDALDGYTKESYQINEGKPVDNTDDFTVPLTKDPQTVTLIYNPILAGTITVNYKYKDKDGQLQNILDENGKPKTTTINGYLFEHSANIKFDALDGYTKESYQINDEDPVINANDFTVPLTKDSQTVTLIYSQTSGSNSSNGSNGSNNSGDNGSGSNGSNASGNGSNSNGNDSGSNGSNGSDNNGSGNNNSNNSGSGNNAGSGINNSSSNNSGNSSSSSGNNSSSSSNNNGATGSIGNNSDNNLNNGSNNTGSNVSSGKHKNTSKKLNKHRNKPSSNNKGFTKLKNKSNKYNNGKTKNMEKAGSSNIATHKEKLLPQTGSNKRSSLAVLALGGLALASALGAIWFNHKED